MVEDHVGTVFKHFVVGMYQQRPEDENLHQATQKPEMYHTLGVVHNCQHLCIHTERTEGEGGTMPAYYY